jgi:hypothetical protein
MISISSSAARVFLSNFLAFVLIPAFALTAGKCVLVGALLIVAGTAIRLS